PRSGRQKNPRHYNSCELCRPLRGLWRIIGIFPVPIRRDWAIFKTSAARTSLAFSGFDAFLHFVDRVAHEVERFRAMATLVGGGMLEIVLCTLKSIFGALHVRLIRRCGKEIFGTQRYGVVVTTIVHDAGIHFGDRAID